MTDRNKPMTQYYKVRANKAKPRIWIEGKKLTHAAFVAGTRFNITREDGKVYLYSNPQGSHKVSGNESRPIIDLSGKSCAPFETGHPVFVTYYPTGQITIEEAAIS